MAKYYIYLASMGFFYTAFVESSNETSLDSGNTECALRPNSSAITTGSNLWCYECKENYIKKYDPFNSPCRFNLSQIVIRQCGPGDRYCKIERLELHRQVLTIERGCVGTCPYGCRFNGFGLTYMRCTSCCRTYGCNDDNGGWMTSLPVLTLLACLLTHAV